MRFTAGRASVVAEFNAARDVEYAEVLERRTRPYERVGRQAVRRDRFASTAVRSR
jgi:hypothetical protein